MYPLRRLLLREVRGVYIVPALSGYQPRCLSTSKASDVSSQRPEGNSRRTSLLGVGVVGAVASGLCLAWYLRDDKESGRHVPSVVKLLPQVTASERKEEATTEKVSIRERRYKDFCSISYKGEPYMTPRDFLESVTHDSPRRRSFLLLLLLFYFVLANSEIDPQFLNDKDVQQLLKSTLPLSKGSKHSFRDMWNKGSTCLFVA